MTIVMEKLPDGRWKASVAGHPEFEALDVDRDVARASVAYQVAGALGRSRALLEAADGHPDAAATSAPSAEEDPRTAIHARVQFELPEPARLVLSVMPRGGHAVRFLLSQRAFAELQETVHRDTIQLELVEHDDGGPAPPKVLDLRMDPERWEQIGEGSPTGISVLVKSPDGTSTAVDIAVLDRRSLLVWLRSQGGNNALAENTVCALLGHRTSHWPSADPAPSNVPSADDLGPVLKSLADAGVTGSAEVAELTSVMETMRELGALDGDLGDLAAMLHQVDGSTPLAPDAFVRRFLAKMPADRRAVLRAQFEKMIGWLDDAAPDDGGAKDLNASA